MTGRRLYDNYCDTAKKVSAFSWDRSVLAKDDAPAVAWPFLSQRDRSVWNDLARRITPKKRSA